MNSNECGNSRFSNLKEDRNEPSSLINTQNLEGNIIDQKDRNGSEPVLRSFKLQGTSPAINISARQLLIVFAFILTCLCKPVAGCCPRRHANFFECNIGTLPAFLIFAVILCALGLCWHCATTKKKQHSQSTEPAEFDYSFS